MAPLTNLLLPIVVLANVAGAKGPPDIPAVLDSVPRVTKREFELYGPTEEDVRKANDELRVAVSQFVDFLGENPRRMAFVLVRSAAEAGRIDTKPFTRRNLPVFFWVLPAPGAASAQGAPGDGAASYPLGHAAGHRFLVEYVVHALAQAGASAPPAADAPAPADSSHASIASLPDWLEEAVAALCERPVLQKSRIDFIRAHIDSRIPFAELLAMSRPASGRAGGAKGAKQGAGAAGVDRSILFCDESLSLARFIAHREEDRFVGTVIEGVLRGRTATDVLNTSQNLLSRPEALEKQWLEWMQGAERAP